MKVEEGWWEGILHGKSGMFPSNFIKELVTETEIGGNFDEHQIKQGFKDTAGSESDGGDSKSEGTNGTSGAENQAKKIRGFGFGDIFKDKPIKLRPRSMEIENDIASVEKHRRKTRERTCRRCMVGVPGCKEELPGMRGQLSVLAWTPWRSTAVERTNKVGQAKRTSKSKHKQCKICNEPLPDSYIKELCQHCIDNTLQQESSVRMNDIRLMIREELQSLRGSPAVNMERRSRRTLSPIADTSAESGEVDSDISQRLDSSEEEDYVCFPTDNRKGQVFPVNQAIKDLVKKEWAKGQKGFVPVSCKRRYPFDDEDLAVWSKIPKVDAAVASTSRRSSLPVEDAGSLPDPMDRKSDALLKRSWEACVTAFKPAISATSTSRSMLVWLEQLDQNIKSGVSREKLRASIPLIKGAAAFISDASIDSLRLAARTASLTNTARRALWLKNWKGDAQSRAKLCTIPCQGEYLFGTVLDEILTKAGERKEGFPNPFIPSYRRAFKKPPFGRKGGFRDHKTDGITRISNKEEICSISAPSSQQINSADYISPLSGSHTRVFSDNTTAVAYLNHQGGTRSDKLREVASDIMELAEGHLLSLSAVHIRGIDNFHADFLSRHTLHQGEWMLNRKIFRLITARWGVPQIDLFSTRANRQGKTKGTRVTKNTLSRWIREAIILAYKAGEKADLNSIAPPVGSSDPTSHNQP
ncbi:unnamed protein product [Ranitomeya imitator]|uniref:SH3 domain-containing protein n=1 Tax=Ranitomeya imitator TaxID=111125 RepID=A0ABN9M9M7_9NEOB|nr:unnamed protein product [Ranitomeya imitator]